MTTGGAGRAAAVAIGFVIALVLAEVGVRAVGHAPWPVASASEEPPLQHDLDDVLGWVPRPGLYRDAPDGDPPIEVTIWPNRARATGTASIGDAADVVIVGGSYTFGQEVGDADTWPWRLRAALDRVRVQNLAGNAYGTYQSLLRLERHLERAPEAPRVVIYGLFDHHQTRNIASRRWLESLETGNQRGVFRVPYATLDAQGQLARASEPAAWPRLPLRNSLALVPLVERGVVWWRGRQREGTGAAVTQQLLLALDAEARRGGGQLLVVTLDARPQARDAYAAWLRGVGIEHVDCSDPRVRSRAWRARDGSGHPNVRAHTFWARCVTDPLRSMLGVAAPTS